MASKQSGGEGGRFAAVAMSPSPAHAPRQRSRNGLEQGLRPARWEPFRPSIPYFPPSPSFRLRREREHLSESHRLTVAAYIAASIPRLTCPGLCVSFGLVRALVGCHVLQLFWLNADR